MDYDIETIDSWSPPEHNGLELLGMPNIVHQLHGLAPRTIMGQAKWNLVRKKAYMVTDYTCEICGKKCKAGRCDLHEVYETNYKNETALFKRFVVLCLACHGTFIHSGRAITIYTNNGSPKDKKMELLKIVGDRFKMIQQWNKKHPDDIIRVSDTFLEWAKTPRLKTSMESMFEMYDVKFASPNIPKLDTHWGNWKLIWEGKEYPSPYATYGEWKEKYQA